MPVPIRTPLDETIEHAGPLTEYHGALVPAWYTDPIAEHRAVRQSAGVFDFAFRCRFTAQGADRVRFIHSMVSNDVKRLSAGQGTYAVLLDVRGHILADVRIFSTEDKLIIETDRDLLDKVLQTLNRYNIGNRVPLEPMEPPAVSIQGPHSRSIVEETLGTRLTLGDELSHAVATFASFPLRVVASGSTGEEGYDLWIEKAGLTPLWNALLRSGQNRGAVAAGSVALESLRIEAGIPKYGGELSEDTLLLEAGLLNAVSFTKGCYIGQEIVERQRSRGHVNWQLIGLVLESGAEPAKSAKLHHDGKEAGEITSVCQSPTLGKKVALGYVRREFAEPGTRLGLDSGGEAETTSLPFYRRQAE
jgi:folate-binding protein YgfZ